MRAAAGLRLAEGPATQWEAEALEEWKARAPHPEESLAWVLEPANTLLWAMTAAHEGKGDRRALDAAHGAYIAALEATGLIAHEAVMPMQCAIHEGNPAAFTAAFRAAHEAGLI